MKFSPLVRITCVSLPLGILLFTIFPAEPVLYPCGVPRRILSTESRSNLTILISKVCPCGRFWQCTVLSHLTTLSIAVQLQFYKIFYFLLYTCARPHFCHPYSAASSYQITGLDICVHLLFRRNLYQQKFIVLQQQHIKYMIVKQRRTLPSIAPVSLFRLQQPGPSQILHGGRIAKQHFLKLSLIFQREKARISVFSPAIFHF